ncbi:hypothetical protein [Lysinibacillus sp. TE18511]
MINAKVKVSKEVAEALDGALMKFDGSKGKLLETHVRTKTEVGVNWTEYLFCGTNAPLDTLSTNEMAIALYVGYEVEKAPEEMVAEQYRSRRRLYDTFGNDEDYGAMEGIEFVAKAYGLKIEGVDVK